MKKPDTTGPDPTPDQDISRRVRKLNRSAAVILLLLFLLGALNPIFIKKTAAIFLSVTLALAYFSLRTKISKANVCLLVLTLLLYGLYVSSLFRAT